MGSSRFFHCFSIHQSIHHFVTVSLTKVVNIMDSIKEQSVVGELGISPAVTSQMEKAASPGHVVVDTRRDNALDFLQQYKNEESVELSKVASFTKALRRKIDWRLMPFLCLSYTLNFIDKVLLNVSLRLGISGQLGATNIEFSTRKSWEWSISSI